MASDGVQNGIAPPSEYCMFWDIDNCLYPKSYKIHEHMSELIDQYFQTHLALPPREANELHQRYYKDYGLAIEGLVRHHKIDPLEYNEQVDNALPLDDIIKPNPALRRLLEQVDRSRVKMWLFTNAYVTHGKRVVKLLGIEDMFDGITYCDYAEEKLLCKPAKGMFQKAMRQAQAPDLAKCYFVDDSALNIAGAKSFGWNTAHIVEPGAKGPPEPVGDHQIQSLEELRSLFPELFKPTGR